MKYVLLCLLLVSHAEASDRTNQFSVGAGLGPALEAPWAEDDFKSAVGPGPKVSLFGRYQFDDSYTGWELTMDYFQMAERSLSSRSFSLSMFWRYMPGRRIHPILSLGGGISRAHSFFASGDGDQPFFRLRAGVEWELDKKTDVAFHLDHFSIFKEIPGQPNLQVLAPTISLIRYFGTASPTLDSTIASLPPQADGDSDGDGVKDSVDRCKGTPHGQAVNDLGCALKQAFEIKLDLKFRTNSTQIEGDSEHPLEELAKILQDNDDLKVEVQGHTDSSGGAKKNQRLSQERADRVRDLLVSKHGVNANRLVAKGYGSSQPVDTNNNPEGRKNNRRVVAKVIR